MGKHPEKILVVQATLVSHLVGEGFTPGVDALKQLLRPGAAAFAVRDDVEGDPAWRQIIPYVLFFAPESGGSVFTYVRARSGGESRLFDLLSCGVGGHVEESDFPVHETGCYEGGYADYSDAVLREIGEEVSFEAAGATVSFAASGVVTDSPTLAVVPVGLINDGSDAVGRDHLAVLHFCVAPHQCVAAKEGHLADARWMPRDELESSFDRFESWSKIALRDFLFPGFAVS